MLALSVSRQAFWGSLPVCEYLTLLFPGCQGQRILWLSFWFLESFIPLERMNHYLWMQVFLFHSAVLIVGSTVSLLSLFLIIYLWMQAVIENIPLKQKNLQWNWKHLSSSMHFSNQHIHHWPQFNWIKNQISRSSYRGKFLQVKQNNPHLYLKII